MTPIEKAEYLLEEFKKQVQEDIELRYQIIRNAKLKLNELQKELEELNKPKRFKPESDEYFFYILKGNILTTKYWDTDNDRFFYKTRNCFKTKEEAEEELERILFVNEVRDFIEKENGGWFFDDNGNENGFLISIENDILSITEWRFGYRHSSISKYFKSKEIGEKILAKFDNQKLIRWFI